jgi:1-acyl-sn-glycerol-3-phosphate acyltransferase
MLPSSPLMLSRWLLTLLGTKISLLYEERIPKIDKILVVSNHRSFLDPSVLMTALNRPVRFACHYYMTQVPGLREIVNSLGCVPLDEPGQLQQSFFERASGLLQTHQAVGIFPEGGQPMVQVTERSEVCPFHRGFAHLALRAQVGEMAILPVAIASTDETSYPVAPFRLFSMFAPTEHLFERPGWHPAIIYHRVSILFGYPRWITDVQRREYQNQRGGTLARELSESCYNEISSLLRKRLN